MRQPIVITFLRSIIYHICFVLWLFLIGGWGIILHRNSTDQKIADWARLWVRGAALIAKVCTGITHEFQGRAHLPQGPFIVASQHQSAWETIMYFLLLPSPVFVLKQELLQIPIVSWYMRRLGMIAIDRKAGLKSMRKMLQSVRDLPHYRTLIIFPEGTRVAPGKPINLQPGIMAVYKNSDLPVVPVALNSGLCWPRNAFLRHPGHITVKILSALEVGLTRDEFMTRLQAAIESQQADLLPRDAGPHAVPPFQNARANLNSDK